MKKACTFKKSHPRELQYESSGWKAERRSRLTYEYVCIHTLIGTVFVCVYIYIHIYMKTVGGRLKDGQGDISKETNVYGKRPINKT